MTVTLAKLRLHYSSRLSFILVSITRIPDNPSSRTQLADSECIDREHRKKKFPPKKKRHTWQRLNLQSPAHKLQGRDLTSWHSYNTVTCMASVYKHMRK